MPEALVPWAQTGLGDGVLGGTPQIVASFKGLEWNHLTNIYIYILYIISRSSLEVQKRYPAHCAGFEPQKTFERFRLVDV